MKRSKVIKIIIFVCIIIMVTGCGRYWEKQPVDYPNTTWKSENPYLEIVVDKDGMAHNRMDIGNGDIIDVDILYRDNWMVCCPPAKLIDGEYKYIDKDKYFKAKCKYSKEKCILNIVKCNLKSLKEVDKIILYNQDYKK